MGVQLLVRLVRRVCKVVLRKLMGSLRAAILDLELGPRAGW